MRRLLQFLPAARGRRISLLVGAVAILSLAAVVSQAGAVLSLSNPPTFNFVNDQQGADDQPGQKDLNAQAVATPGPGDLWVAWTWDDTSLSGGNTGDACGLFDTNSNGKVNFAICAEIAGNPATQAAGSPRVFTCGDGKVDRCTSTYTQVASINSACSTNTNATDPFHNGKKDTEAICHIDLNDVGGSSGTPPNLVNTCSYPSAQPTSAPSDCVLIPRDAFLVIKKVASPNIATQAFPFHVDLDSTNPIVFTAMGSQQSNPIPIQSGKAYKVKEDVPTNWAIDTPAPSCSGASGTGTSNGTFSTDTISGITAASDNVITCTYNDKQLTGAIQITKQQTGGTPKLSGAHFTINGSGDYTTGSDGTVCVAGLPLSSYSVNETAAPNGYSLDSTNPRTVNVTSAGTCTSGATGVTFSDDVVPGTINIHKTDGSGGALAGATFTLYADNAPVGGSRGSEDTATTKTCGPTNASGDCSITSVPLGNYWVVETGAPNGYTAASDRAVTIGVGSSPGVGDSHSLTFADSVALGTVNVHKTGLNGADLPGAEFTLYTDASPFTSAFDPGSDTATTKKCQTGAGGTCTITGVVPGPYWLVETVTPAGYGTADPTAVNVPLGSQPGTGATVNVPTISDSAVPGSVGIHKTGINGSALSGATFTLYADNAPVGGSLGNEDTATTKTCATTSSGDCTISGVAPGNYWAVETTTPAGYNTASPKTVVVTLGATANVGDSESLTFADQVVAGTVSITKTDDANNPLTGAEFTLYNDAAPVGGTRDNAQTDTITTLKCSTGAAGTCDISAVAPGNYWVVESGTPPHYDTAPDKAITVGLGSAAGQGDRVPVSLVDPRKHRVIVLVCHEGTDTLFSRDVTVNGTTKQSLPPGTLTAAQQKALCDTGGASFGDISGHPDVQPLIKLDTNSGP